MYIFHLCTVCTIYLYAMYLYMQKKKNIYMYIFLNKIAKIAIDFDVH